MKITGKRLLRARDLFLQAYDSAKDIDAALLVVLEDYEIRRDRRLHIPPASAEEATKVSPGLEVGVRVIECVCLESKLTAAQMLSRARVPLITGPRHVAMTVMRRLGLDISVIARVFGRDRTVVRHGLHMVALSTELTALATKVEERLKTASTATLEPFPASDTGEERAA